MQQAELFEARELYVLSFQMENNRKKPQGRGKSSGEGRKDENTTATASKGDSQQK
jgi:hypothetical protein